MFARLLVLGSGDREPVSGRESAECRNVGSVFHRALAADTSLHAEISANLRHIEAQHVTPTQTIVWVLNIDDVIVYEFLRTKERKFGT